MNQRNFGASLCIPYLSNEFHAQNHDFLGYGLFPEDVPPQF